jgi:hypothetical protein
MRFAQEHVGVAKVVYRMRVHGGAPDQRRNSLPAM